MRSIASLLVCAICAATIASLGACSSSTTSDAPAPAASTPPAATTTAPPAATTPPAPMNALAAGIDDLFTAAAAVDKFSGSVLVVDGGKQVLAKGYGFADRDSKRKNAADTVYRVGSVSKQFAATAILALAQDGKLALTDPVSKFFPDYPTANLAMDGTEVTIHHLLSHTSGLPDPAGTAAFKAAIWRRAIVPSEQVGFAETLPLVSKPGETFAYLNYNFLLAALIVEKTSGMPYETFLRTRFFTPLGMNDSGTVIPASLQSRVAPGYYEDAAGDLSNFQDAPGFADRDVTVAFGAGQVYSTIFDLAKWDRALAGTALLPADKRDLLFTPNLDFYGYGWVIQKSGGVTMEWHNGALEPLGYSALIVRVPSKDRFVAYLSNFDYPMIEGFEPKVEALAVK